MPFPVQTVTLRTFATTLGFLAAICGSVWGQGAPPSNSADAVDSIVAPADGESLQRTEARLRDDLAFLASDELEGRGPYSRGQELAVERVAARFDELRLRPLFRDSYFQPFAAKSRLVIDPASELTATSPDSKSTPVRAGVDFVPLHRTRLALDATPIAFAGFGITAPEHDYDDYAGLDVEGKAVVLLRHEPHSDDPAIFAGRKNSTHAYLTTKVALARRHGAAAVLFVTDRDSFAAADEEEDAFVSLASATKLDENELPVFHVKRKVAERWFPLEGEASLVARETAIHATRKPASNASLDVTISGTSGLTSADRAMRNVAALLPGVGELADEHLVIGAHVDHVGRGEFGSLAPWTNEIHNGADDNASGAATLMELARRTVALADDRPDVPRRSVVFIGFVGEEMGLLGSAYFVRNAPIDRSKIEAMLNFDMVGRYRGKLILSGYDTSPEFKRSLPRVSAGSGLRFEYESGGYGPSDHASFYAAGVPVIHFFTGLHDQYHRPSDDYDTLNVADMARISDFAARFAWSLATTTREIDPAGAASESIASESIAGEDWSGDAAAGARPLLGVTLDRTAPQAVLGKGGYPVGGALDANPSAAALLRRGDLIVEFDGQSVDRPDDLLLLVQEKAAGDAVRLMVRRDGETLTFKIRLAARR